MIQYLLAVSAGSAWRVTPQFFILTPGGAISSIACLIITAYGTRQLDALATSTNLTLPVQCCRPQRRLVALEGLEIFKSKSSMIDPRARM